MPTSIDIAIVGGGVSGLCTALAILDRCTQLGAPAPNLLVLEADSRAGGKIRTNNENGFTCEWGVNGFLNKEPRTLELVQRLGLEQRLLPASAAFNKRYIFTRGRLRPVRMHPLGFLFSGLLPLGAKIRLIRELWVPPRPPSLGDETVADFARRRVGPEAFKVLVDPMQTGIFAGDPERMSVLSSFPRVVEVEKEYGSLIRGMARLAKERRAQGEPLPGAGPRGHLTSFKGGMERLIDGLTGVIGERLRLGAEVRTLRTVEGGFELQGLGLDGPLRARHLVLACPAHVASTLAAGLDPELAALLGDIPYSPIAVVCLGYPREAVAHPMDGFGFLAPREAGLRLLGALWTSTIFPERTPEGQVLVRAMIGGARDPQALELDDEALVATVHGELAPVMGLGQAPSFRLVFRHPLGIPMYTLGHGDRLERMQKIVETRLPGLTLTGNAYRGIGVNDCAREAVPLALPIVDRLLGHGPVPHSDGGGAQRA